MHLLTTYYLTVKSVIVPVEHVKLIPAKDAPSGDFDPMLIQV
jgi:hypothetical protein